MSGETGEPRARRTVLISDGGSGVPGSGGAIDPLIAAPIPPPPPTAPPSTAPPPAAPSEPSAPSEDATEEAARPAGERRPTTVVIADHDLPDATYTVTESRSPDDPGNRPRVDPRMKARRLAVRREAGRRRLWWVIAAGVVVLLGLGALAVFSSTLFDVERVEVTGAVNTNLVEIREVTDDLLGTAILTADLDAIEERLERLPWVKYAQVTMDFPHTVRVQISERTPVAAFQSSDDRWRVIDLEGRVIDILSGRPIDYVAIFGPGPDAIAGEQAPEYAKVAQFITALPPSLRPRVQHFTVDDRLTVTMTMILSGQVGGDQTEVELCAAKDLDVQQLVALTAFIESEIDPERTPPATINACKDDLITTTE